MTTLDSLTSSLRTRLLALKGLRSLHGLAKEAGVSRATLTNFLQANAPISRLTHARLEAWATKQEQETAHE